MGNTEYFELCETSSKIQCPDCASHWEAGILCCTWGKCMQPTERNRQLNKERFDVLSIPGSVIKNNPTHGARHGPSMRQCMCCKAHEHKSGGYKTILERCHDDDKYRKSFSGIGCAEEQIIQYDAIALEDHSLRGYMARKKSERKILECSRYSRAIESAQ